VGVPAAQFAAEMANQEKILKNLEDMLKSRRDHYENAAVRKPLLEQVALARSHGLADTALNLLLAALKSDPATLSDRRNPNLRPGAVLTVHLLLGLGRLDDAREALSPPADQKFDRRSFGTLSGGTPAYEWMVAQLGAATGDYEAADKALAEGIELLWRAPEASLFLRQLNFIPRDGREGKEADLSTLAAVLTGDALLRNATLATRRPWQILLHITSPGPAQKWSQVILARFPPMGDLWTIRAWLALEQGRTERVGEYARKALELSDLGFGAPGVRQILVFPSRRLVGLCLERIEKPKRGRK
jgi:hypothetical protein